MGFEYFSPVNKNGDESASMSALPRKTHLYEKIASSGMLVYKQGGTTDLTVGRIINIMDKAPKGWHDSGEDQDVSYCKCDDDDGSHDAEDWGRDMEGGSEVAEVVDEDE